jgi:hypothetical protein
MSNLGRPRLPLPVDDLILHDLTVNIVGSPGNRYSQETYDLAHRISQIGKGNAFEEIRKELPLPSRQSIEKNLPEDYVKTNLTDLSECCVRIREWRNSQHIPPHQQIRAVLAVDAVAFKPEVVVSPGSIQGIDVSELIAGDMDSLIEDMLGSREKFLDFVNRNWNDVIQAAFIWQIQPLDPDVKPLVFYAQTSRDGKARQEHIDMIEVLVREGFRRHVTLSIVAADGDNGYNHLHDQQYEWHLRNCPWPFGPVLIRRRRLMCDPLHLLKRVRYRMLKGTAMVLGFHDSAPRLDLEAIKELLKDLLPPVVFSDDQLTKMHDSLPIQLFRFNVLWRIFEAHLMPWFVYMLPWVILNEALSRPNISRSRRLEWLYCCQACLMLYDRELRLRGLGQNVSEFVKRDGAKTSVRCLFDRRLVIHAINTVSTIIYEMIIAEGTISLQRLGTVCVEKLFGVTRLHAGTHQTVSAMLGTMEHDQAMKFASEQTKICKRQTYGEIVTL